MAHNWFEWMEDVLTQIESILPHCPDEVKQELVYRFRHLQDVNDEWLDEWLLLQERFRNMIEQYPELAQNETPAWPVDEKPLSQNSATVAKQDSSVASETDDQMEFWIDERVLHQFREGQGYYQLLMFPQAMSQFMQVIETEPDFLLGRLYLALTCFHREQWEEAEKQFELILQTAPHDEFRRFSHHMLGCLHVKQNQDVKAVRQFSRALALDENNADTLFNLGACHYRLRSIRLAIPCFEQAVLHNEDDWESMLYLARCHTAIGFPDGAIQWRKLAYETSQKPHIISEIADDYERQDQPDKALKWHLYCVTKHPEWAEGYHGVAWNIWKKNHNPQAIVWLKKALTLKKDDPNILFSYWWITRSIGTSGERERIEKYLSTVMRESPLWQLAHGNRHRIKGETEQAKMTLIPLLDATEAKIQGAAYYQLAHLYMAEQKWPEAVKHFHAARDRDEQLHETWLFEGICHYLYGDEEASKQCLELYQSQQANA